MECPRCKLVNPPTAKRCDCGYDFETKTVEQSYLPKGPKRPRSVTLLGVASMIFGVAGAPAEVPPGEAGPLLAAWAFGLALAVAWVVGGVGALRLQPWARTTIQVCAALSLLATLVETVAYLSSGLAFPYVGQMLLSLLFVAVLIATSRPDVKAVFKREPRRPE